MNTDWENTKIDPFQTGRLRTDYTNIKKYFEWNDTNDAYQNGDCPFLGIVELYRPRKVTKSLWATAYTAVNSAGEEVYIFEYTRAMARKVDLQMFEIDPKGAISTSGLNIQKIVDLLVKRFPLEKNFEKYWLELKTNEEYMVPQNFHNPSSYYPPNWDVSIAEIVPMLQFYVETKDDPYNSCFSNPVPASVYFEKNPSTYNVKKRFFIEGLRMVHRLLQFELFSELVNNSVFLVRVLENIPKSYDSDDENISCTYAIFRVFLLILKFVFAEEYYKGTNLKKLPSLLCDINMAVPFSSIVDGLIQTLFNNDKTKLNWKDLRENLPEEMFFLLSRISEKPDILQGNRLKRLITELEYPYEDNKIECYEKVKLLGKGNFGYVYLARHKGTDQYYAIKVIRHYVPGVSMKKRQLFLRNLFATLPLACQMQHKNVVRQIDAWTSNTHHNWLEHTTEYDSDDGTSSKVEPTEDKMPALLPKAREIHREGGVIRKKAVNTESYSEVVGSSRSVYVTAQAEHFKEPEERAIDYGGRLNEDNRYTFIVMQAAQQSLSVVMGVAERPDKEKYQTLKKSECIRYMKQFIDGVEYLNSIGFMHRDLKPQNALISFRGKNLLNSSSGNLLIADLDTVKRMNVDQEASEMLKQTNVRTPLYVSPEMDSGIYNEKTDYYSIGISFAQMLYPQYCRIDKSSQNTFLQLLHQDRLPETLHPQFAFLLRWMTEKNPTDRIGFLSFPLLKALLQKHKYKNWYSKYADCYSVIIEHKETGRMLKCIRVANRKDTLREVIRRFSRRPEYYAKVLTRDRKRLARLHGQENEERPANIYLRLENATDFEANTNNFKAQSEQKMLELNGNNLILNHISDYVYVCCGFDEFETYLGKYSNVNKWLISVFERYYVSFVRWGAYSYSNIHRSHFKPNYFVIEPHLLDEFSSDVEDTLLWPPEKLNASFKMTEAGSIFSFGLFLLWNLLANEQVPETRIRTAVNHLKKGEWPCDVEILQPYLRQLIFWLCSYKPENRPRIDNLSTHPQRFSSWSQSNHFFSNKTTFYDDFHHYRITFNPMDYANVTRNRTTTKTLRKEYFRESGLLYMTPNEEHRYIYTISNRNDVLEKVLTRMKMCGDYILLPQRLIIGSQSTNVKKSDYMLDMNVSGRLIVSPRSVDAVDWCLHEEGDCLAKTHYFGNKPSALLLVHKSLINALEFLDGFHKNGIYHGNIDYDTFLINETGGFCFSHPLIVEEMNEHFNPTTCISDCSSPEQILSGVGSTESDIFSLGITLFAFICYVNDEHKVNLKMFQEGEKLVFPQIVPQGYADLIRKMTCLNPAERISCKEVIQILQTNCSQHLAELHERERKLFVDKSKKTERQLPVAR